MSRRRPGGRGGWRSRVVGFGVLVLAGVGLWYGAAWTDGDAGALFRALDREPAEVSPLPVPVPDGRVRVEVLNAGGVRGVAARARDELRDGGFDVVEYGNAPSFGREASVVILRAGDADMAVAVARLLGIEEVRIEPDASLLVEVTVLLGTTWMDREARSAAAAERIPE